MYLSIRRSWWISPGYEMKPLAVALVLLRSGVSFLVLFLFVFGVVFLVVFAVSVGGCPVSSSSMIDSWDDVLDGDSFLVNGEYLLWN